MTSPMGSPMAQNLPKLPGMTFQDPRAATKKRGQTLKYINGYAVPGDAPLTPGDVEQLTAEYATLSASGGLLSPTRGRTPPYGSPSYGSPKVGMGVLSPTAARGGAMTPGGGLADMGATGAFLPDRIVLRFYAFFKESVQETREENFRVRKCVIYFYAEDGSIHVAEPKVPNSGIPQGVFLKRHKVPKASGGYYDQSDLGIGQDLTFYGRTFHIVDCDKFTLEYLLRQGIQMPPAEPYPPEPLEQFKATLAAAAKASASIRTDDLTRYMEARLGKPSNLLDPDKLEQFNLYDRKVLRFFCLWDDRDALYGLRRPYVLHYFLADDTVEVLEINEPNSGRDPYPMFLKRGPLPKAGGVRPPGVKNVDKVTDADLMVGQYVTVFGRSFFIHDCDDFTREHYIQKFGFTREDMMPIDVSEEAPALPQAAVPPHNGFGSREDTLQNCISLVPKPPKKDFHKLMEKDKCVLRWQCALVETQDSVGQLSDVDKARSFILQYFLGDDTLSIFEPPVRNSGIIGGKFLERQRVHKPGTAQKYAATDLWTGGLVCVHKRHFMLQEADEYTYKYMEENCREGWPLSDFPSVSSSFKHDLDKRGGEGALRSALRNAALVTEADLRSALQGMGLDTPLQAVKTLVRGTRAAKDGKVDVSALLAGL
eukprot:jgi/Mesvir1/3846/Mv19812-RA.1